jgi:hypothetical protein
MWSFCPVFPISSFKVVDTEKLKDLDLPEFLDEFFLMCSCDLALLYVFS